MPLTRTTLAAACGINDVEITVASATGIVAGDTVRIDGEDMKVGKAYASGVVIPVGRGKGGTAVTAHVSGAGVVHGSGIDWEDPASQLPVGFPIAGRARTLVSYSAIAAIALPVAGSDAVAILNGTSALAMTLADPGPDNDGDILIILGNGKAAHTVTYTAGLGDGGSGYTVVTFPTGGQACLSLIAANETWVALASPFAGTVTAIDLSVA